MSNKCTCAFCETYSLFKWASINECGCGCHKGNDIVGHEGLCCPYPNGKMENNPHTNLDTSKHYLAILNLLEKEADEEIEKYDRSRMEELRIKFESKKYE